MLGASRTNITEVVELFNRLGLRPAYLVPTETGLQKCILDATEPVREFLKRAGIHDYSVQVVGPFGKQVRPAQLFTGVGAPISLQAMLYRPQTKSGDPRIWFTRLGSFVQPRDLLALLDDPAGIVVINCSSAAVLAELRSVGDGHLGSSHLSQWICSRQSGELRTLKEVISNIRSATGGLWHRTRRSGDTGVGMTLESLLGIASNSRRGPDLLGVEIKTKRLSRTGRVSRSGRVSLFAQVPNWSVSPLKSSSALLDEVGYQGKENGRMQLNCTVNARKPNTQGLLLQVSEDERLLKEVCIRSSGDFQDLVIWDVSKLRERLRDKHRATVFVYARPEGSGLDERFRYESLEYQSQPRDEMFATFLRESIVTVDHLIARDRDSRVSERGPLFRVSSADRAKVFSLSKPISLLHDVVDF